MGVWPTSIALLMCAILLAGFAAYMMPAAEAFCIPPYGMDGLGAVAQGDHLYLLWAYNTDRSEKGDYYLQFARSADAGSSFDEVVNIYHTESTCTIYPRMAADGENFYVMWEDLGDIMFRGSNDAGKTFGEIIPLGKGEFGDVGRSGMMDGGRILASGDRVYIAWYDGNGNIVFRKSDDAGRSFYAPVMLSKVSESYEPRISSAGKNVYIIWTENYGCLSVCETKLLFVQSGDYGETFSEPRTFEELTDNDISMPAYPIIKSHGNDVYMLWKEDFWNFYFSASHDGGKTFSEKVKITDFGERESGYTTLFSTFEDDAVYIGWQSREGRNAILKSTDGGQTFASADLTIPESFAPPPGMVLMEKEGHSYFLWPSHLSRNSTIVSFASVLEGAGKEPGSVDVIEYSEHKPYGSMMIASGDIVHIVWTNSTGPESSYRQQLYVMTSIDAGHSFGDSVEIASITTVPEFPYPAVLIVSAVIGTIIAISRMGLLARFYATGN